MSNEDLRLLRRRPSEPPGFGSFLVLAFLFVLLLAAGGSRWGIRRGSSLGGVVSDWWTTGTFDPSVPMFLGVAVLVVAGVFWLWWSE